MDLFKRKSTSIIFCDALYVWSRQFASDSLWKLLKFQGVRWVTFPFAVILLWKLRKYKIQKVDKLFSVHSIAHVFLIFYHYFFLSCCEGSFSFLLDLQCKLAGSVSSGRILDAGDTIALTFRLINSVIPTTSVWLTYGEKPSCQISWNSIRIVMATIHPQKSTCFLFTLE